MLIDFDCKPSILSNPETSLDTSFGKGGLVENSIDTANNQSHAIAIQNDGKILVAGLDGTEPAMVRYNTDGSLDKTFHGTGSLQTDLGTGSYISDIVIQPDGKILVRSLQVLKRLTADGYTDNTFNKAALDDDYTTPSASRGLALQKERQNNCL